MGSRGIFLLDSAIASPPGLNGGCLTLALRGSSANLTDIRFQPVLPQHVGPALLPNRGGWFRIVCCAVRCAGSGWRVLSQASQSAQSVSQSVILRVLRCFRSLDPASSHGQSSDHAARDPDRCRSDSQGHHTGATHPSLTSIYNRNSGPRCSGEVLKGHHEGTF